LVDNLGRDSGSEIKKVETLPAETSLLIKEIRKSLEATYEAHQKLVVGMNEWSINDFFFQKAGSSKWKQTLLFMVAYPDQQLLKLSEYNKQRSRNRVNAFLDNVISVLDDYALFKGGVDNEITSIKNFAEQYRRRFPKSRHKRSVTQIAAVLSAIFSAIMLGYTLLNAIDPSGFTFFGILISFGGLAVMGSAISAMILFGIDLRLYLWQRKLLKQFDVVKKENVTYGRLRKLTRLMSHDLHKSS